MPFFSIIIPTYNRSEILNETIKYIQHQDLQDWECIVVDDGSTDNTKLLVNQLILHDTRIKYFYQANAERSAARNNGARKAKGLYLIFLDSDDAFAPNYLQELFLFLKKKNNPKALIVSDFCIWDGYQKRDVQIYPSISNSASEWLFNYPVSPSRACIHSEIFKKFQFREDIVIVEDSVLWVSIATEFPILHFQKPLVWYRVHEGNSVNPKSNSGLKRLAGLKLFFNDNLSRNLEIDFKNKLLSDCYFNIGQHYVRKSRYLAVKNLLISIYVQPINFQTKAKIFMIFTLIPLFNSIWKFIGKGK